MKTDEHVCDRECLRMMGSHSWCARFSWNGRRSIEHADWQNTDLQHKLTAKEWDVLIARPKTARESA